MTSCDAILRSCMPCQSDCPLRADTSDHPASHAPRSGLETGRDSKRDISGRLKNAATRFAYENTMLLILETGRTPTRSLEYNIIRARAAWPPKLSAAQKTLLGFYRGMGERSLPSSDRTPSSPAVLFSQKMKRLPNFPPVWDRQGGNIGRRFKSAHWDATYARRRRGASLSAYLPDAYAVYLCGALLSCLFRATRPAPLYCLSLPPCLLYSCSTRRGSC